MDKSLALHVATTLGNIQCAENQILHGEWRGTLGLVATFTQEILEIAAGEQFEHNEARMAIEADANEVDDVWMVEFRHDGGLHQEIRLCLSSRQLRKGFHGHRHLNSIAVAMTVQSLVDFTERTLPEGPECVFEAMIDKLRHIIDSFPSGLLTLRDANSRAPLAADS